MFGFFKKKNKRLSVSDKVWQSTEETKNNLMEDIRLKTEENIQVCLFYYFEDTKKELEELLQQKGLENNSKIELFSASKFAYSIRLESQLKKHFERGNATIFFVEHYPSYAKEKAVLEKIGILLGQKTAVIFYTSLESSLLKMFGSERIVELMKKMGYAENECAEHAMISKSIQRAQEKLEKKVENEIEADSQEEWFKRNGI